MLYNAKFILFFSPVVSFGGGEGGGGRGNYNSTSIFQLVAIAIFRASDERVGCP